LGINKKKRNDGSAQEREVFPTIEGDLRRRRAQFPEKKEDAGKVDTLSHESCVKKGVVSLSGKKRKERSICKRGFPWAIKTALEEGGKKLPGKI